MKQPQGLAIKTLHKKTVVSLLAASIIVTQQGFEPSQRVLSTKEERMIRYPIYLQIARDLICKIGVLCTTMGVLEVMLLSWFLRRNQYLIIRMLDF